MGAKMFSYGGAMSLGFPIVKSFWEKQKPDDSEDAD
jgi:hypothetical protein